MYEKENKKEQDACSRFCDVLERYIVCFIFTSVMVFTVQSALFYFEPALRQYFWWSRPLSYYICANLYFHFFLCIYMTPTRPNVPIAPWNQDGKNCVICRPLKRKKCNLHKKFCGWCNLHKTESIHHCTTCGTCVQNMDHHCMFMGTCINDENYRHFFFALVWLILSTFYCACVILYLHASDILLQLSTIRQYSGHIIALTITRKRRRTRYRGSRFQREWMEKPMLYWASCYLDLTVSFLVVLLIGRLLYHQMKLTWKGKTMLENMFFKEPEQKGRPKGLQWLKQRIRSTGHWWWISFFIPMFGEKSKSLVGKRS